MGRRIARGVEQIETRDGAFVVGVSSWSYGAIGIGAGDREWIDRGSVQKLSGAADEADGSGVEVRASQQNRPHRLAPLLRTVKKRMKYSH